MKLGARILLAGALLLVTYPFRAAAGAPPLPPKPTKYVTDLAGALPAERAAALNEKLAAFERETSSQVLVYVDSRIPEGTTLEEFSSRAIREWGVGQKGKSNGAIFFLFTGDRKMRLEVGYGLEGALPDVLAHRIDDEVFKPRLQAGDTAGAMDAGTDAILGVLRGEPYQGTWKTVAESRKGGTAARPASVSIFAALLPFLFFFGIAGFFIAAIVAGIRKSKRGERASTGGWTGAAGSSSAGGWSSSSSDSSSSSSSDSSSSSSDFSGGGGDGGGGGSSDSY